MDTAMAADMDTAAATGTVDMIVTTTTGAADVMDTDVGDVTVMVTAAAVMRTVAVADMATMAEREAA